MNKTMVACIVVISIFFFAGCVRQQLPALEIRAELPEAAPEPASAGSEAAVPAAEAVTESQSPPTKQNELKTEPAKEKSVLASEHTTPNSVIVSQKTVMGRAGDTNKKEEPVSWFSDVVCGKLFPDGESLVRFTFENKDAKIYYLTKVTVEELTEKDGVNIHLNSDRALDNPKKECGVEMVKPGQKVTCTVKEKLRKGTSYWEKELFNKLTASSVGLYSELKFTCEGIAE